MILEEIMSGESQYLELKRDIPDKSEKYMKTVVAFANGSGGKIVFGIEDRTHEVVGIAQETVFRVMDGITTAICDSCTPMITPIVSMASIKDKVVIIVTIQAGGQRPYYITAKGKENGTYIRVSGTTRPADPFVLKELEFEGSNRCFDQTYAAPNAAVSDEQIDELCEKMYRYSMRQCVTKEEISQIKQLTKQNLISWGFLIKRDGKYYPTNAFVLMTDNVLPQATIQCGLFKGVNRDVFIDRKEYAGDIVNQLDEAYEYVLRNINMGAEIDGLHRRDIYELPTDCIREMICNAGVHRSYLHPSSIQLAIYVDRVEVTSPGMLFGSLKIEDIKQGISIPRNRALVYAFTYMKIMEHWGSGIPKIIRRCKEEGLREPELTEIGGSFRINLYRFPDKTRVGKSTDNIRISTDNIRISTDNYSLSQVKILTYLEENEKITNREVQQLLNVKDSRALKVLSGMVDEGILKKKGKLKGSYYIINKNR